MQIEISADGNVRTASAGVGQLLVDNSPSAIDAFCANLFQGITLNQAYNATVIDAATFNPASGAAAAWLMRTFLPQVNAATGVARQERGAALQLTIWDMLSDGGNGFGAGRVQATTRTNSAVLALAEAWRLEGLDKTARAGVFTNATGAPAFQQQIFLDPAPVGGEVPEPGTMAMAALASAGLIWMKRRSAC